MAGQNIPNAHFIRVDAYMYDKDNHIIKCEVKVEVSKTGEVIYRTFYTDDWDEVPYIGDGCAIDMRNKRLFLVSSWYPDPSDLT